jgi:hypothetical protein
MTGAFACTVEAHFLSLTYDVAFAKHIFSISKRAYKRQFVTAFAGSFDSRQTTKCSFGCVIAMTLDLS